ncbi:MAG: glycoside hydrolase family 127 protein [Prevotella sp.]|nr:glycoside hydrolase family 127 protein [Prevotella sp.]
MKLITRLASVAFSAFVALPALSQEYSVYGDSLIGHITPCGWLREFLHRQQTGLTGHPEALSYPYNTCLWAGEIERTYESKEAKDWWRYEQTAYYTDGLLRLGYLLGDEELIKKGEDGISYTIREASPNGRLGNKKIESLWPMAVFFRAMKASYDVTHNPQIPAALEKNYLSLTVNDLVYGRRHIVNLEGLLWTYGQTRNPRLLQMAEEAYAKGGFELDAKACASDDMIRMHGVTYSEMMKIPLYLYAYTGKKDYLELALNAQRKMERDHMLPDGVQTSAEFTAGNDIDIAHETCDVTDYTWALGCFLAVTGDARWADRIEKAIFNAGPGAVTKDFGALQYFSCVNQVIATGSSDNNEYRRGKTWMQYRPVHETECCAGNVHRFMPNFASRLWMRGRDNALVCALYSPSEVSVEIDDAACHVSEETAYPFDGRIEFTFHTSRPVAFPFVFRIPEWCGKAEVTVNGKRWKRVLRAGTFVEMNRRFRSGDRVVVTLEMEPEVKTVEGQGVYVQRGPLLFARAIAAKVEEDTTVYPNMSGKRSGNAAFQCLSMTPAEPWNYGVERSRLTRENISVAVDRGRLSVGYPYDPHGVPVKISIPVRRVKWDLLNGTLNPPLPEPGTAQPISGEERIELVPYGSTTLRLTVFPVVE